MSKFKSQHFLVIIVAFFVYLSGFLWESRNNLKNEIENQKYITSSLRIDNESLQRMLSIRTDELAKKDATINYYYSCLKVR